MGANDNPYSETVDNIDAQTVDGFNPSTEDSLDNYGAGEGALDLANARQVIDYVDEQIVIVNDPMAAMGAITGTPTGLNAQGDIVVTWDKTLGKITVAPSGIASVKIYINGVDRDIPVLGDSVIDGVDFDFLEGSWYFFYIINALGTDLILTASQTLPTDYALVASGYYNADSETVAAHDYLSSATTGVAIGEVVLAVAGSITGGVVAGHYYMKITANLGSTPLAAVDMSVGAWQDVTSYVADVVYPDFLGGVLDYAQHTNKITPWGRKDQEYYTGAKYYNGLNLFYNIDVSASPTDDRNSRVAVEAGRIDLEDVVIAITKSTTPSGDFDQYLGGINNTEAITIPALLPVMYKDSAGDWCMSKPMPWGFLHGGTTTRPYWNESGVGLTEVTSGKSVPYFVVATGNRKYPVVLIMGQAQYDTPALAEVDPYQSISWGNFTFSKQIKVLWRLVFECSTAYSTAIHRAALRSVADYRSNTGNFINRLLTQQHASLDGLEYENSGHTGFTRKLINTTAPTVNDDALLNYAIGDEWADTSGKATYTCSDNTAGAAVWVKDVDSTSALAAKANLTIISSHGFLPKSQCAISGAVDANGYANFLSETTPDEILISATTTPLVLAFANGFDLYGEKNFIAVISADVSPAAWQGAGILASTGTNYLYVELDAGGTVLTYGYTLVPPEYEYATSGTTADSSYYVIPKRLMYVYDGGFAVKRRVFLGECVVAASHITSVITYALNGRFFGTVPMPNADTKASLNHYIGVNTNQLKYDVKAKCITAEGDYVENDLMEIMEYVGTNNESVSKSVSRLTISKIRGSTPPYSYAIQRDGGGIFAPTQANWAYLMIVERSF